LDDRKKIYSPNNASAARVSPGSVIPFEVKYKEQPSLDKTSGPGIYCKNENSKKGLGILGK